MTILQLAITHIFILGAAGLTRLLSGFLELLGLGAVVAPSTLQAVPTNRPAKYQPRSASLLHMLFQGSGGIAGGGLLEFDMRTAKHVLPVAVVFVAKVVLSNLSYAYASH